MSKRSKKYKDMQEAIGTDTKSLKDAIDTLKALPKAKFDESVDIAIRLGIDTRKGEQTVRGALPLPHGTGSNISVVVIAGDEAAEAAREAGADHVGFDDMIEKIDGGWLDFDILIATPAAMPKLRPLARTLGPKGMMPNPKTGTLTDDTGKAVREAKAGRVEYRADKAGIVHATIGKISFETEALVENIQALIEALYRAKPPTAKGEYLISAYVATTYSPSVKLELAQIART